MDRLFSWITKTMAFMCQLIGWITKRVSRWCFFKGNSAMPPVDQLRKENAAMPPDWYLDHASECWKHVQQMTSDSNNVKVYPRQCKYLVEKLELAIKSSRKSLDRFLSLEHKTDCLEALNFLFRLAKEVESIIKDCCGDESWILVAFTWTSLPLRVSTLGWYLQLCIELLRNSNRLGAAWQTFTAVEGLREVELHAVEERASTNEADLLSLWESKSKFTLGRVLLERLKVVKGMPISGSQQLSNLGFWELDSGQFERGIQINKSAFVVVYKARLFGASC